MNQLELTVIYALSMKPNIINSQLPLDVDLTYRRGIIAGVTSSYSSATRDKPIESIPL